jgi:hypothetical protein
MVIFNSYVKLPEGIYTYIHIHIYIYIIVVYDCSRVPNEKKWCS